jgi:beta-fructofuranosidase
VIQDGDHLLIYSCYFLGGSVSTHRSLPPPKDLDVDSEGRLVLKSFYRWREKMIAIIDQKDFPDFKPLFKNKTAIVEQEEDMYFFESRSGYEIFAIDKPDENFIWEGDLKLEGLGKCGLILDSDEEGNGYYISLDFVNGFVQFRVWGFNPDDVQNNFVFENLQTNQFTVSPDNSIRFKLIRYGNYIELSIDGIVKLTLVDYKYTGSKIGVYSASSVLSLANSTISILNNDEREYGGADEILNCEVKTEKNT